MKNEFSTLKNTKLFQILPLISKKEHKKLRQFLSSPYFNKQQKVLDLFDYLIKLPKKSSSILTKGQLHEQVFPNTAYKDDRLRLLLSQLVQLIEQYWVTEVQVKDTISNKTVLANFYRKQKVAKLFEQTHSATKQLLQNQPLQNATYYFENYQLQLAHYQHASFLKRMSTHNLQEVSVSLDTAFLIRKLKVACLAIAHQQVFQQDYEFGLLQAALKHIEENELTQIPAIGIYYHSYFALLEEDTTPHLQAFKKLLFNYQHQFPQEELMDLYLLGINCYIRMINKGNTHFLEEVMALYQQGLKTEALLENGVLSRFTYQNIVSTGMLIKEYQWTHDFLNDYKGKVEKEYRESAYRFNKGRLAYQEKRYEEALDLLKNTDHKDLLINLFSKTLLLKIYYELEEFKLLNAFLEAFNIYLRRKKVIGYHKEHYKNIIYYTQQLMKLNPYDKAAKQGLKERIESAEKLLEKKWLLEQLARLG